MATKDSKKSKGLGPDHTAPIRLHHLSPIAIQNLTDVINISTQTAALPNVWKVARIIPLQKSGKPVDDSRSFRPFALLSLISKVIERLLLNEFFNMLNEFFNMQNTNVASEPNIQPQQLWAL